MKEFLVIFDDTGAWIEKNPDEISKHKGKPNSILNPDLSQVKGLPPHAWNLVDGLIVPASDKEAKNRHKQLHNLVTPSPIPVKSHLFIKYLVSFLAGAVVASALLILF
jgi:hypothetical protein